MTTQNKNEIKNLLADYCDTFISQSKAAASLDNCSEAAVIQILKCNWDSISDAMWLTVGKQVGFTGKEIQLVETLTFQTLCLYYDIAKDEGSTIAAIGIAGIGKSYSGKWYAKAHRKNNVYYLECAEYWSKKDFLRLLLSKIGKSYEGLSITEMMQTIVRELRRQNKPLIILDEIDKLSDPVLKFFITLYNELNRLCGFVWTSTSAIEKRIAKGVNSNKGGYQELKSRIGQNFIMLPQANASEIRELCEANEIIKAEDIARIINECNGDLRRVDRNVLKNRIRKSMTSLKKAS
jgi:Cdc6-like AAA superfamily ATPase